jgi:hypothetical protein
MCILLCQTKPLVAILSGDHCDERQYAAQEGKKVIYSEKSSLKW